MECRIEEAIKTIKMNDRGGFTVPTNRLYPYQWNWDSGFTALGIWHFNKWRAWLEIMALLDAQWEDGMVPHIVFRQNDPDYFPGPGYGRPIPNRHPAGIRNRRSGEHDFADGAERYGL